MLCLLLLVVTSCSSQSGHKEEINTDTQVTEEEILEGKAEEPPSTATFRIAGEYD